MDRPQPFFGSGRSTSLSSPGSESEESKDDSSEFFPDFVAAMRHTPTPDPQQSINEKASVQDHTNGFENLKPSAKLIIDPSCRAKGVSNLYLVHHAISKLTIFRSLLGQKPKPDLNNSKSISPMTNHISCRIRTVF